MGEHGDSNWSDDRPERRQRPEKSDRLDVHIHLPASVMGAVTQLLGMVSAMRQELSNLHVKADTIMATQAEAAAQLATTGAVLDKVSAETTKLLADIQTLKDAAAAGGDVSPELQTAIDQVASRAAAIDAQVDDVAPNPTPSGRGRRA